jgi:hypothetical protein
MNSASPAVRYSSAAIVGVAISTIICLCGAFLLYGFESDPQQQQDPYLISEQFTRLGPVLSKVPRDAVLGYLSDAQTRSVLDSALMGGAQYVLAPRLIERGAAHDWILGNFTQPANFAAVAQNFGLRLEQDFGNGVVLFRRMH